MTPPLAFDLPGLPPEFWALLVRAAAGDRLALVGGAVRDLLLHRVHRDPWLGVPDLDLVVEPAPGSATGLAPAHRLARRLRELVGSENLLRYQEHGAYGTVELELALGDSPWLLDIASARRETYPQAGENPEVRFGSLEDDLARRDFSINAIALLLDRGGEPPAAVRQEPPGPRLLDPHGGQADLARRQLRLMHGDSLLDDPSRIVRAARYAARLGFDLAPESLEQLRRTLAQWPWRWRPGESPQQVPAALGTRLRMELELLLEREPWPQALAALQRWQALPLIDAELQQDRLLRLRLHWAERFGVPLLPALLLGAAQPLALAERLQLPHRQHRLIAQVLELDRRLQDWAAQHRAADRVWAPSRWCALLEAPGLSAEAVALALAAGLGPRRPLLRWWGRWRHLRAGCSAADLLAAGMVAGPALGERLRQLRAERLDRERC
ncbi:MAG: CCA tRNA nucleotidyltransferase [Cyanobium sp.]